MAPTVELHSSLRLQLHGAIYRPDSFVLMLRYCANLKAIGYESTSLNRIVDDKLHRVIVTLLQDRLKGRVRLIASCRWVIRLRLHRAIHRPDSFILMLCYFANLRAIRYESTSFNRIVADKLHRVIVALLQGSGNSLLFQP